MKRLLCALALVVFAAAPAWADPKSDLASSMIQFSKATSFHMSATSRGKTVEVDMVKPGKVHIVVAPMEMIKIDNTMYVKMGGTWRQFTLPGMDRIADMYQGALDKSTHPTDDMVVVDLGMKTVEGATLHAYTIKNKGDTGPTTLYIDDKGFPARVETSDGSVVRFSNINGPIAINAPV